jgi:hypothetical protein
VNKPSAQKGQIQNWMNLSGKRTQGLKNPGKANRAEGANPIRVNLSGKRQGRQMYLPAS